MTVLSLPAPARPAPLPRFRLGQPVLMPDNRVAIYCGSCLTPKGLQAFVVDAATPARHRRSRMVQYRDLRAAPCGGPRLAIDNARNPFAGIDAEQAPKPAIAIAALGDCTGRTAQTALVDFEAIRAVPGPEPSRYADATPLPAFLRASWARDAEGRKLRPYPPRIALLALLAFRLWPAMAAKRFDAARLVEAARTGALICGPSDLTLLARIASSRPHP